MTDNKKGMNIPMSSPRLSKADIEAVNEVLETRYLSIGPKNIEFEKKLASYVGLDFGVSVNSGTSGLHLAIIAAGVEEGDMVITTPFSFIASANSILFERAIPIFVDIDPLTYNIDPGQVAQVVKDIVSGDGSRSKWIPRNLKNSNKRIGKLKALLPVDAFGQPADYEPLQKIANESGLLIIEDSCEALGAEYKGRPAGSLGDIGVFAFYPNKQITTGGGGMLVTDNKAWADLFRSLRNQGRDVFDAWLNHTRLGYNYRLNEMSAALGLSQLNQIDDLISSRTRVAGWYSDRLSEVMGLEIPVVLPSTTKMSWFVYVVRITAEIGRDHMMKRLSENGIPSRPYFTPIHVQPFYRDKFGYQDGDYPHTEQAGDQCLALPFSSIMTEEQVEHVCNSLKSILNPEAGK